MIAYRKTMILVIVLPVINVAGNLENQVLELIAKTDRKVCI